MRDSNIKKAISASPPVTVPTYTGGVLVPGPSKTHTEVVASITVQVEVAIGIWRVARARACRQPILLSPRCQQELSTEYTTLFLEVNRRKSSTAGFLGHIGALPRRRVTGPANNFRRLLSRTTPPGPRRASPPQGEGTFRKIAFPPLLSPP